MSRRLVRWAAPAALLLAPLGLWMYPAFGQRAPGQPAEDPGRIKEMVKLMEQGQLTLSQAVELAEKHVNGRSIQAACSIEAGAAARPEKPGVVPPKPDQPRGPSAAAQAGSGAKLMYEVRCFAKERVVVVHVDGLTRKVAEARSTDTSLGG